MASVAFGMVSLASEEPTGGSAITCANAGELESAVVIDTASRASKQ
jgi:hypothetical protein